MSELVRITTTTTENLQVLGTMGQRSVELITGTLFQRLSPAHAALFAEPIFSDQGDQADWYTEVPGTAYSLSDLSEDDCLVVEERLGALIDDIRALSKVMAVAKDPETQRLAEALENATRFPGHQSVHAVKSPEGEFTPILVDWASITDGRSGPSSAALVTWTPRREVAAAPLAPSSPAPIVNQQLAPPVRRNWSWLVWLLSLLVGGLTAAILLLLLPACGLTSILGADQCPRGETLASQILADEVDRLNRDREVLENRITFLERDVNASETACSAAVPPPPPEPEAEEPDEIDERLKREDAQLGDLNFALVWDSPADLDLHVTCPSGGTINYISPRSASCGGVLDVDMNAGGRRSNDPVEHIYFNDPPRGTYRIMVHFYDARSRGGNHNFVLRVSYAGETKEFSGVVSRQNPRWNESFNYDG